MMIATEMSQMTPATARTHQYRHNPSSPIHAREKFNLIFTDSLLKMVKKLFNMAYYRLKIAGNVQSN